MAFNMDHRAATRELTVLKGRDRDFTRAIACSAAISERDNFARCLGILMTLNPEDKFEEIYLSPPSEEQQFVMAHAADAVFIAFEGSKRLKDFACEMMVNKVDNNHLGLYHSGIYQRSSAFFGLLGTRMLRSLAKWIESGKRIIFCGHSLGGAVAHMVLMRLLLENELFDVKNEEVLAPNDMISIAFGAPHLCDKIAAGLINDTPNYKCRFINFVNRQDPVPRLLHDLNSSVAKMIFEAEALIAASTRLELLGELAGTYQTFSTSGKFNNWNDPEDSSVQVSTQSWRDLIDDLEKYGPKEENEYKPIGSYVFLEPDQPEAVKSIESTSESIIGYMRDVQFQHLIEHHVCPSYLKALFDASLIRGHVHPEAGDAIKYASTTAPKPEVSEASAAPLDGGNTYIFQIRGKDLMLLRGVQLNGEDMEPRNLLITAAEILFSSDKYLVFVSKDYPTYQKKKLLRKVEVSTAFGSTNKEISLRNLPSLLPKLVQSMMQMAAVNELRPTEDQELRLDRILRCRASNATDGPTMKSVLESCRRETAAEKASPKIGEVNQINQMVEAAKEFMQSDLSLKFGSLKLKACKPASLSLKAPAVGYLKDSVAAGAPAFAGLVFSTGVTVMLPFTKGTKVGLDHLLNGEAWLYELDILDYGAVLQTGVTEVRRWNVPYIKHPKSSGPVTEDDLVAAVDGSDREFKAMLEAAVGVVGYTGQFQLKDRLLQYATQESIKNFLKRIYAIVETRKLYKELNIEGRFFVAILGEEDAGKSSFIQEVLKREGVRPDDESLPAEGVDIHTQDVTPYKLKSGMILVDFPGINGADEKYANWWEQFTALPALVVLLLNFQNDIKRDQIEMYNLIMNNVKQSAVMVAFNKVDRELSGMTRGLYLKKDATGKGTHFPQLARKTAAKLGCYPEDVHYVALRPFDDEMIELEKQLKMYNMEDLQKVGVLDLNGFMEEINKRRTTAQTMKKI